MKATVFYRIVSGLLVVVAAGNTFGLVRFWQAVGSVSPVRFPWGHSGFSWGQVVLGMEVFCSLCVLFGAYVAWHLGGLARRSPEAIGAMGWMLFAYQLLGIYISLIFLSGFVRVLAICIAICAGYAAWLSRGGARRAAAEERAQG
jgi:hypothetical protein